jgi:DNA-binding transcriptional LysR family regulator
MLGEGQIDLAIGYYPDMKSTSLFKQRLVMHGFSCMMRKGHPAAKRLTKAVFSELEHVVVENASRTQEMVDIYLDKRKIYRKVRIRTAHYLSLPMIVTSSDLIATVPTAAGQIFASMAKVQLVDLPYSMPQYAVQQYWHRRFDNDPRSRWLRQQVSELFKTQSAWHAPN